MANIAPQTSSQLRQAKVHISGYNFAAFLSTSVSSERRRLMGMLWVVGCARFVVGRLCAFISRPIYSVVLLFAKVVVAFISSLKLEKLLLLVCSAAKFP
jgi:uncharacterized membrane protein